MRVLFRLAQQAFHYRTRMFIAWTTMVLAAAMFVAVPWIVGTAVEETLKAETASSRLWLLGGLLLAFTGARGVFQYLNQYLGESIAHRVCYNLRNSVYDKLQRISFAFHDQEHTGNLMSKATVDIEMVRMFITMGLIRSFQMGMLILFAAVLVLRMDLLLGLVTLLFVPVLAVMAARISMRMRSTWRLVQDEMGRMTTVLQENLTGMRVVKAFGAEEFENAKFKERSDSVYANTYVAERLRASNNALMQVVFWSTTGLVLWLGGRAVVDGRLSANELTQFILYVSLLVQPVRMLGQMVSTYARAHSAGERIFEVLDAESPVIERPNAVPLQKVEGHVAFDNVSFAYAVQPAVSGVSFVLAPGQVGALMGAPGSGKTTLAHLLARFYDADDGRITIDGVDIRDTTLESLRQTVGTVQQDVFLFSATVHENIAYGRQDATREEVIAAAKTAQLDEEIMAMSDGYDTMVGERGVTLSGGQRQRLSIARTLLIDPPILVLDDSTSSVDAETESKIQQAMANIVRGRTTLIIAHRLTSIQHASLVAVLDHGRIVEMGTPEELWQQEGFYRHIAELQDPGAVASSPLAMAPVSEPAGGSSS